MLRNFWPEQKVTAWKAELFPNSFYEEGIETAANLISLNPLVHSLWNRGAFALKPISVSDDNSTLTVQFFWQAEYEQIKSTMNLHTIPPSTRDLDRFGDSRITNYRLPEDRSIKSGDLFVIKTDDPNARPLPSTSLLEMQWFFQRIMGMTGAANVEEDIEEPGDSDGAISDLELMEVGDVSFISNDTGPSDPAVPGISHSHLLPTVEEPKHQTEEIGGEEAVSQYGA
jgi:hypothetical protein